MNDRITQHLYKTFVARGFATLRFNFRGVGRSQGSFDNGIGELSDAAAALDWVQSIHPEASTTWIAETRPSRGLVSSFSIFMACSTTRRSPRLTT